MPAIKRLHKLVELLAKRYEQDEKKGELTDQRDPFIVGTWFILGQHSKRNGQARAFDALRRAKGVTPSQLLSVTHEKLRTICQTAGPYDDVRLKELEAFADVIEEKGTAEFVKAFKKPVNDARAFLEKEIRRTRAFADLLLLYAGFPVFPVNNHIIRCCARLGYIKPKLERDGGEKAYKEVQKILESESVKSSEWIIRAHGLLHRCAHDICTMTQPNCPNCPLLSDCPFGKKRVEALEKAAAAAGPDAVAPVRRGKYSMR